MKKISVILCMLLCFALLTACKGGDDGKSSEGGSVSLAGHWRRGSSDVIEFKEDGTFVWELGGAAYDWTGKWDNKKIRIGDEDDGRYYDIVEAGKNILRIRWMNDEKTETIYRMGSNALIGRWTLEETNAEKGAPSIFGTAGDMQKNGATFILEFKTDGICSETYSMMRGLNTTDDYSYGVEGSQLYMYTNGEKMGYKVDGNTLTLTEDSYTITLKKME